MRTAIALAALGLFLWLATSENVLRGEVELPAADPRASISVSAQQSQRWQQGEYVVWLLHGNCEIRQGDVVARSRDAVLWIAAGQMWANEPSKVLAYLENDVAIDNGTRGAAHRATGRPAQTLTGQSWLGRFQTLASIDVRAPLGGPSPVSRPPIVARGLEALNWDEPPGVVPAQFTSPLPPAEVIPAPQPTARSVSIRSRSNVPWQAKSFAGSNPQETILAINSGVQIVVRGIENVPAVQSGVVSIESDRVVIWTTALAGLNLGDGAIQQASGRWEFYLEGNIIFREGDRVIYADRMYYDANENRGTVLNAEMLTPVPSYEGLVRLKADVLQQLDRQNFLAHGGALTSSRLGVPSYWFQSETVTFQDIQRPLADPFTGQAAIDPSTGDPAVEHELQARSYNNFVYAGGWPVLYWPVMSTDLTKPNYYVDRVRLGGDRVFGTQVAVDWDAYQLLGIRKPPAGTKWSVATDWLSERGFGLGSKFNYDRPDVFGIPGPASGFLNAWGIQEQGFDNLGRDRLALVPEADLRGRVYGRHRQMLRNGYQFTGELGVVSDINFLEQYYEQEWDELKDQTTGVDLKKYLGNSTWDIAADVRVNPWFTQTEWLPRFDHFLLGQSLLGDRLTWLAHSHVGYARLGVAEPPSAENQALGDVFDYLPWESADGTTPLEAEGPRAATRQELDLPLDLGPFKVVPYVLGELGYWGTTLDEQEVTRAYGQAGVRASLPFWRVDPGVQSLLYNLNGLSHKVTLDADFFWADATQNVDTFPLYDPLEDDGDEHSRRRFTTRTFGGVIPPQFEERWYAVRTGMQSWVTARSAEIADDLLWTKLGIRQRWQTKRGLPGQERIVDWIALDVEATYFPEPDRDNFGQPFGMFNYDFRWHVGDRLTLLSDGYADFFDQGLQTIMVGGQITRPERGNLFLSYRWFEGPFRSEILSASVAYRLSEKWVVTAGSVVDMTDTGNIGQSVGITRIGESLLTQIGFNVDTSRDNVGLNFAIEPRFLPRTLVGVGGIQIPPAGAYGFE